jgi:prepilin-type processing-associated H-X9-DG protein
MLEQCFDKWNGISGTWAYRCHVNIGIDLWWAGYGRGINEWSYEPWGGAAYAYSHLPGRLAQWASAGSLHTGGCHALLADGSVHFLSENIDKNTRQRLSVIGDGQPLNYSF